MSWFNFCYFNDYIFGAVRRSDNTNTTLIQRLQCSAEYSIHKGNEWRLYNYFRRSVNSKFSGRPRITLPYTPSLHIKRTVSKNQEFSHRYAIKELRDAVDFEYVKDQDRNTWNKQVYWDDLQNRWSRDKWSNALNVSAKTANICIGWKTYSYTGKQGMQLITDY